MYLVTANTSIEFYYNTKVIREIAEMQSAYKAARLENASDIVNYTSDETDFGEYEISNTINEIFSYFRKIMVDEMVYFNDTGTLHGSDPFCGMFIHENNKWDIGLLIMLDHMISEAAAAGLLYKWYLLTPTSELAEYYRNLYLNKLSRINNVAFNLKKPITNAMLLPTANIPNICSYTVSLPARTEYEISHCINSDDYIVQSYDANGKQININVIKRDPGVLTVYSNTAIANVTFTFTGKK